LTKTYDSFVGNFDENIPSKLALMDVRQAANSGGTGLNRFGLAVIHLEQGQDTHHLESLRRKR
jgi:hypothetical protein